MPKKHPVGFAQKRVIAFTLIEMLTVITIIAILAGLVLAAASGVMQRGARARAQGEIQAMSTALESYKVDNGIYPVGATGGATGSALGGSPYGNFDPGSGAYQESSEALYQALSGQTNYTDIPVAGIKSYMTFKSSQIGNPTGPSYVKDPWNNSYGYSTGGPFSSPVASGDPTPFNGVGFFDLWSTGNTTKDSGANFATNAWISNWQ